MKLFYTFLFVMTGISTCSIYGMELFEDKDAKIASLEKRCGLLQKKLAEKDALLKFAPRVVGKLQSSLALIEQLETDLCSVQQSLDESIAELRTKNQQIVSLNSFIATISAGIFREDNNAKTTVKKEFMNMVTLTKCILQDARCHNSSATTQQQLLQRLAEKDSVIVHLTKRTVRDHALIEELRQRIRARTAVTKQKENIPGPVNTPFKPQVHAS